MLPVGIDKIVKRLFSQSAIYTIAVGIEALAPFFLLPFLTRTIEPNEYGYWILFVSLVSFTRPLVGLTLQDAIRMRFFELPHSGLVRLFRSSFVISSMTTLLLYVLFLPVQDKLSYWLKFPVQWLWTILLAAYLYSIFYTFLALFQFLGKRLHFAFAQLAQALLTLSIAVIAVLAGLNWPGVVGARIAGLLFAILVCIVLSYAWLRKGFSEEYDGRHTVELIKFGLYYLPSGLSLPLIALTNRLVIAHLASIKETGFYGIGEQFSMVLWLAVFGFIHAWQPKLFRVVKNGDIDSAQEAWIGVLVFVVLLPVIAVIIWGCSLVGLPLLVGSSFSESGAYVAWLINAKVFQGYFYFVMVFLLWQKRVKVMSIVSMLVIILNIFSNLWFVDRFGGLGSAWATSLSYLVGILITLPLICNSVIELRRSAKGNTVGI